MPKINRNTLLGLVHKGAKALFDDDDLRRDWQKQRTGHRSCKQMTNEQLDSLVKELRRKGALRPPRRYGPKSTGRVIDKIRATWITMHQQGIVKDPAEAALDSWVERMTAKANGGKGIQTLEWLSREPRLQQHLLESLKKWQSEALKREGERQ